MIIVGIAGGTGSGKTTVAKRIAQALPSAAVTTIEHDAYYRDRSELSDEERSQLNYDHPESLQTELLVEHLDRLRAGETISVPIYDFKHHKRADESRRVH